MATATKKRSKATEEAEESAKALKAMDEPADDPSIVDAEYTIEPDVEKVLEAESDEDAADAAEPESDLAFKARSFDEVASINDEVTTAFQAFKAADEIAKAKKKAYEAAVSELRIAISKAAHPEPMPLFEKGAGISEVNPVDETWKGIPLSEALPELPLTILGKLAGVSLTTMGELANYTAKDGGRHKLTDIAGIGQAAVDKIDEASLGFWKRRSASAGVTNYDKDAARMATPIKWDDWDERPADVSKLATVGDLEKMAASLGLSIFDTLRNLGISPVAADDFLNWLDEDVKGK